VPSSEIRVGPPGQALADGETLVARADRTGALVIQQAHARSTETTSRGNVFSMILTATTGGIAAGQLVAAAAAASTQFALFNPATSKYNLVMMRFGYAANSGTPAAGALIHGQFFTVPTLAASGTIRNNRPNGRQSVAVGYTSAAGAALTGGSAPQALMAAGFSYTATAQGATTTSPTLEQVEGAIVLPPGTGWAPLHLGAGTTVLSSYSVTWEEIPI